jgi:cyclopropane-fatty-acyl-phospholipid synthase
LRERRGVNDSGRPARKDLEDPPTAYYELFLDPELHYSAGYFRHEKTSLAEAQRFKAHAVLDHCRIEPRMCLLDVGCGWGALARVAARDYGARVTGITVSHDQYSYAETRQRSEPIEPHIDYRLMRWEDFRDPVDRVVCVNAFENFADKRGFLAHCRGLLPTGGVMVVVTVTADRPIFRTLSREQIIEAGTDVGFAVERSESLAIDYARTLGAFVKNLRDRRADIVRIITPDHHARAVNYYTRCAEFLRSGLNDMYEFTFVAR